MEEPRKDAVRMGTLTLTRKVGETIVIGSGEGAIEVTVREIRRNQVRLRVSAPRDLQVARAEISEGDKK